MSGFQNRVIDGLSTNLFKNELKEQQVSLVFNGMLSQDVLALIGMSLKRKAKNKFMAKRLFGLTVEMTQNILLYSAERIFSPAKQRDIGVGLVGIGQTEKYHFVSAGNYARLEDADSVIRRIDQVNSIAGDRKALQNLKRKFRSAERAGKPGGNIGFIDMVLTARNPLKYSLNKFDADKSEYFFILSARVDKEFALT